MELTREQQAILDGEQGEVMAKIMKTVVMYGDTFGATKLVPITSEYGHIVSSFGVSVITDLGGKDITEVPSHEEVTKAAENAQPTMLAVIKDLVAEC